MPQQMTANSLFAKQSSGLNIACDCCATSDLSAGADSTYRLNHTTAVQRCHIAFTGIITSQNVAVNFCIASNQHKSLTMQGLDSASTINFTGYLSVFNLINTSMEYLVNLVLNMCLPAERASILVSLCCQRLTMIAVQIGRLAWLEEGCSMGWSVHQMLMWVPEHLASEPHGSQRII